MRIKKAEVSKRQYSSKAKKSSNVTSEREGKLSNTRARYAWRKFTEIYGNPRVHAARALCIDFLPVIGTVEGYIYAWIQS